MGYNIFWEDPRYNLAWDRNLSDSAIKSAVNSRIQSLMSKYKEDFIHWDVSNETLHFDFYKGLIMMPPYISIRQHTKQTPLQHFFFE
jgi:GH35 family endo-1,4-beta-xylanase